MRKRLRLLGYNYATNNAYFITVCSYRRRPVFIGTPREIAVRVLVELPARFDGLALDCWACQDDHMHAILRLCDCHVSLSGIVQAYKSITAREIGCRGGVNRVWQRGFYDRIIRSETELEDIREYVVNNALVHAVRAAEHR